MRWGLAKSLARHSTSQAQYLNIALIHRPQSTSSYFDTNGQELPNQGLSLFAARNSTVYDPEPLPSPISPPPEVSRKHARFIRNAMLEHNRDPERAPKFAYRIISEGKRMSKLTDNLLPAASWRLTSHTLVHGYLRSDQPLLAASNLARFVRAGVRIRSATLHATFAMLIAQCPTKPLPLDFGRINLDARDVLTLTPRQVTNPVVRTALRLLLTARRLLIPRTVNMYHSLVRALIVQREWVVTALLFDLMVKDHQLSRTLPSVLHDNPDLEAFYDYLKIEQVHPDRTLMHVLCSALRFRLSSTPSITKINGYEFRSCMQAVAILATLLDRGRLPFKEPQALVTLLFFKFPDIPCKVWVDAHPVPVQVSHAQRYIAGVAESFIEHLPISDPPQVITSSIHAPIQPTLHRDSYNQLLRMSLHRWRNPTLAKKVFEHMTKTLEDPLSPNLKTFGILVRDKELFERMDLDPLVVKKLWADWGGMWLSSRPDESKPKPPKEIGMIWDTDRANELDGPQPQDEYIDSWDGDDGDKPSSQSHDTRDTTTMSVNTRKRKGTLAHPGPGWDRRMMEKLHAANEESRYFEEGTGVLDDEWDEEEEEKGGFRWAGYENSNQGKRNKKGSRHWRDEGASSKEDLE